MGCVKFIYGYCNDMEAMRHFYIDLLGLPLTFYKNDSGGQIFEYNCLGIEFMWFPADPPLPVANEFSRQPGWEGGTLQQLSCSIEYDRAGFDAVVSRLQSEGVTASSAQSENRGSYIAYPVLDPMGNTVEPFCQLGELADPDAEMPEVG